MQKTNSTRQSELKKRRKEAGLVRKEYWATPEQHKKISAMLKGTMGRGRRPSPRRNKVTTDHERVVIPINRRY